MLNSIEDEYNEYEKSRTWNRVYQVIVTLLFAFDYTHYSQNQYEFPSKWEHFITRPSSYLYGNENI